VILGLCLQAAILAGQKSFLGHIEPAVSQQRAGSSLMVRRLSRKKLDAQKSLTIGNSKSPSAGICSMANIAELTHDRQLDAPQVT
jgi:hypothetical protein